MAGDSFAINFSRLAENRPESTDSGGFHEPFFKAWHLAVPNLHPVYDLFAMTGANHSDFEDPLKGRSAQGRWQRGPGMTRNLGAFVRFGQWAGGKTMGIFWGPWFVKSFFPKKMDLVSQIWLWLKFSASVASWQCMV